MRWVGRRQSGNVQDRRGVGGGTLAVGGGIGTIIIVLLALFLGGDPGTILNQGAGGLTGSGSTGSTVAGQADPMKEFVSVVLADTEDLWTQVFQQQLGRAYDAPTLVLFSGSVQTASGFATSATGPFYSPPDKTVYIDLSFFEELEERFKAPGDFAQAYVIAHEVGHHVQNLLGTLDSVTAQQRRVSKAEANELSVRLELQADFLAGIWAHYAKSIGVLEVGDIEEALGAASAIGDDRIQMQSQGYVVPDSFTHGTSEQRARWFTRGYQTGDVRQGDTFSAAEL